MIKLVSGLRRSNGVPIWSRSFIPTCIDRMKEKKVALLNNLHLLLLSVAAYTLNSDEVIGEPTLIILHISKIISQKNEIITLIRNIIVTEETSKSLSTAGMRILGKHLV